MGAPARLIHMEGLDAAKDLGQAMASWFRHLTSRCFCETDRNAAFLGPLIAWSACN